MNLHKDIFIVPFFENYKRDEVIKVSRILRVIIFYSAVVFVGSSLCEAIRMGVFF